MKGKKYIKLIIITSIIVVMILVSLLLYFISHKDNKFFINNNVNNKSMLLDKRIKEIIDESYKYYLLSSGNIKLDENNTVTSDGVEYNLVLLDGINSTKDIDNLLDDLFVKPFIATKKNAIFKNRKYIDKDNKLYLNKSYDVCEVGYVLTDFTYQYSDIGDVIYVSFSSNEIKKLEFQLFNEDGKYKVSVPFYDCRYN